MPLQTLIIPVIFPILAGALIPVLRFQRPARREIYVLTAVIINSILVFSLIANPPEGTFTLISLAPNISIGFHLDGPGMVFAGLLASLWPLASAYAFEYMRHEGRENTFFAWYTITFGTALGVAFSVNLFTLYLCYELLTLVTLPIIMHEMDVRAISAGRKYLMYSVTGAAMAFVAIMIIFSLAGTSIFVYGGLFAKAGKKAAENQGLIMAAFLLAFFGFGVKAAVWPLHGWLPAAGVAPTPVTALLHAVAVVKAGVFAIIRIVYYSLGPSVLKGTWAQQTALAFVCFTIVFGSTMAVKEQHLKRRLAYSTISNLSYILFGVLLMTSDGLTAALSHMLFHAIMKIGLFFVAGALICHYHKEYIWQIRGYGRKMPVSFACFCVSAMAVIGIPGFCGFVSKYCLCDAAISSGNALAPVGIAALIISAILTAIYLFTVIIPAYEPGRDFDWNKVKEVKDPGLYMKIPLVILAIAVIGLGLYAKPLMTVLERVSSGLLG